MPDVSLVFKIHQPFRLRKYDIDYFGKGFGERYFDHGHNKFIFNRVAEKCYWPATKMLLHLIDATRHEKKKFRVAFAISGLWIEQAEKFQPDLIELFRQFPKNLTEFIGETYYHSLSGLYPDKSEFAEQIRMQAGATHSIFGQKPRILTNTELIFNNSIAGIAAELGFEGIFTEGAPHVLDWRSPNFLYKPPAADIPILLRNRALTDDIGYRFSARWWNEWPLTAEKYSSWLSSCGGDCINIYMDYETIGEHHWEDTGIFWFFNALPWQVNKYDSLQFALPREIVRRHKPVGIFDVFELSTISWADNEMDTSAWIGNKMQMMCFQQIREMGHLVKETEDDDIIKAWRMLQASDHLHNICTKFWGDGDVHKYFSYFDTPNQGFVTLMEVLHDFKDMVSESLRKKKLCKE